jgi:AbrB family looped-hinge helix DNA binding protein
MDTIITIDSAGRVVLPKPLRERHGLHTGSELQLRDDGGEIHLRPVAEDSPLRDVHGFLVYVGRSAESPPYNVDRDREERLRRLAGR